MGCFLTTTKQDLNQIKSKMRDQKESGASSSRTDSRLEQFKATTQALSIISPTLAMIYMKKEVGKARYEIGKIGEQIAEKVIEQEMGVTITHRTTSTGPDLMGLTRGKSEICVEVKTTGTEKKFEKLLGKGHGYRQCSDGWLNAVGVDPESTRILGVRIDLIKESVSIYRRVDENAETWKCLASNVPFWKYDLDFD